MESNFRQNLQHNLQDPIHCILHYYGACMQSWRLNIIAAIIPFYTIEQRWPAVYSQRSLAVKEKGPAYPVTVLAIYQLLLGKVNCILNSMITSLCSPTMHATCKACLNTYRTKKTVYWYHFLHHRYSYIAIVMHSSCV